MKETAKESEAQLGLQEEEAKKAEQEEAKQEEKRWRHTYSERPGLAEALSANTMPELTLLRQNMGLSGVSSLKKQELVPVLAEALLLRAPALFQLLDLVQYQWLKKTIAAGGLHVVGEEEESLWRELETVGWVFRGTFPAGKAVFLPQEFAELFARFDQEGLGKVAARNEQWTRLTTGLLHYYGVLSTEEIKTFLEALTGKEVVEEEVLGVLSWYRLYSDGDIACGEGLWWDWRVDDVESVRQEQELRSSLPFATFSYEQLYAAGKADFVEDYPAFQELLEVFQSNWELDRQVARELAAYSVEMIRNDKDVSLLLQELGEALEFPNMEVVQGLTKALISLHNETPLWVLKGHAPQELRLQGVEDPHLELIKKKQPVVNTNKIGRNELCPCGSGKKYKKCCGAN
ncbi:SEC-C metal-binding domain-containing protein [Anaeroarcus burkinensis]|uniref:SEC-C metal-binding domain-containing protein n=1 Tax=Anaeroarcus burkinensis TaxID=82376 RepID=UPI00041A11E4|nr:SEC-C metal-binding domain-containing protein [Anaeroarcus burkinensis]